MIGEERLVAVETKARGLGDSDVPHLLHRVCDLLWRLPKDEVPFAVKVSMR